MAPDGWENISRLLAIRLDNIGDVVMLGPALRTLRAALPDAEITLMASPVGSQVAPLLPWVDHVWTLRAVWQDASNAMPLDAAREMALVEQVRARGFDAAVIFTSFSQSPYPPAYVCYLAGVPIRLGQSKEFGGSVLTRWVRSLPDEVHQVDRNLHLLESAGFELAGRHLELHVPEDALASTASLLGSMGIEPGEPYIVAAPGASCPARRYDIGRFAQVVRILGDETSVPVVVVGSERESDLLRPVLDLAPERRVISLVGKTGISELAEVVRGASLVIANDSGPMHMADAFLRPSVILYSGTEYESQWRPRFAPTRLLRRPTPCSPCYRFTCPYNMECLDIPPAEVAAEALDLLAQTGEQSLTLSRSRLILSGEPRHE